MLVSFMCLFEGVKALWEDYASGSRERKRLLENRYGCNLLVSIAEKKLSDNWIANNTKSCPECFTRIEVCTHLSTFVQTCEHRAVQREFLIEFAHTCVVLYVTEGWRV